MLRGNTFSLFYFISADLNLVSHHDVIFNLQRIE